jgi:hypothetical protein
MFGVPTAAEIQIDREIAEAQAAFAAGRQISQIEPWSQRLSRCCPAVRQMMEIDSLLAVDDEEPIVEPMETETQGDERPYDEAMQIELRIALYALQVESEKEIDYVPSTTIL